MNCDEIANIFEFFNSSYNSFLKDLSDPPSSSLVQVFPPGSLGSTKLYQLGTRFNTRRNVHYKLVERARWTARQKQSSEKSLQKVHQKHQKETTKKQFQELPKL